MKNIENLLRAHVKKNIKEKTIGRFFGEVEAADKKNFALISGKVNKGDEMKNTLNFEF